MSHCQSHSTGHNEKYGGAFRGPLPGGEPALGPHGTTRALAGAATLAVVSHTSCLHPAWAFVGPFVLPAMGGSRPPLLLPCTARSKLRGASIAGLAGAWSVIAREWF